MLGLEDIKKEKFSGKRACEVCKWINKNLILEYSTIPEVKQLIATHEDTHVYAKNIINFMSDDYEEAKKTYNKIENTTKTLFLLIDRIEKEINFHQETQ
ncbi:MAG: hypothetical protein CSA05_01845 [Bacteroidia bacterium]|nr:MAG: hypothetical protein CSA05_01845 [Bacteroidia bacterium]